MPGLDDVRFWRILRPKLQEEIDRTTDHLIRGAYENYADYKAGAATVAALKKFIALAEDTLVEMDNPNTRRTLG